MSIYVFHKPVSQLKVEIDSEEFTKYLAFFSLWRLPDSWQQMAITCNTIANCHGAKTKPSSFLPKVVGENRKSATEIQSLLKSFASNTKG